jgi:DME family drug/metabolite transporter
MQKSVGLNLSFIAFAAVSWGVGGFVAAVLYHHSGLGPIAVTFWRYAGGLALLAALRPFLRTPVERTTGTKMRILNGIGMAVYQTAYYVAIDLGGVGIVTVVTLGSGPVLIALGARLFLAERLGRAGLATVGASVLGLALLVAQNPQTGRHPLAGIAIALISAAGYAAVTLLNRASSGDPYDAALGGFAIGAALLLPLTLLEGPLPDADGLAGTLGLLAFLGAVPTALAYALFFRGLAVVRATTASVVALSEPLTAVALGALILHEPLTLWSAAGGAILLASVVALAIQERRGRTTGAPLDASTLVSTARKE